MTRLLLFSILLFVKTTLYAQPTQNIRGSVIDHNSGLPVPFASVAVLNTVPLLGTVSDSAGNFTLTNVPVGRYNLKVTCVGYESLLIPELIVSSAKQAIVHVQLKASSSQLREVVVSTGVSKEQALNPMASVSARMLSVEEAKRYAGGFDDPARLATSFAGVAGNTGFNGIIVRGNAPKFLQWKMEGVEIPTPNHFGDLQSFGGGLLTALSSQMLANSDFFTGAFPAEYNNALSGVFDISMRKGNNEKREHTFQAGIIGIDASSEGPFRKGGKSTYLFNYRYSTLALLTPLLPENADKIRYQDLSFKLHFPTQKSGSFSIWGISLADAAHAKAKTDSSAWKYFDDKEENDIKQYSGALGMTHKYFLGNEAYVKTTVAATLNKTDWEAQKLSSRLSLLPQSNISVANSNFVLSSHINKRFNKRHSHKSGLTLTGMRYDLLLNKALKDSSAVSQLVNSSGFSSLISGFSSSSVNISSKLLMNLGLNVQLFTLNQHYTLEPRLGFRYRLSPKHSLGFAYGLHSRLENLNYYFNNSLSTGETAVNKNLDFTKAHHFVLGYDWNLSDLLHIKVESYYQHLYAVPVMANSSFSFLNLQNDWFFSEKLQNTGEGINYGLDICVERYMSKGYYYVFSASLFQSTYKGGDGIWRNTRFNRSYVVNFLAGKEWQTGAGKANTLNINIRASNQGGNRYSPVNEAASQAARDVVFDESKAFSRQFDPALNIHLTMSYKVNRKKSSREIALKILNLTSQPDFYGFKYNYQDQKVDKDMAAIMIPNLSYKIEF